MIYQNDMDCELNVSISDGISKVALPKYLAII